mgnify:FL=1
MKLLSFNIQMDYKRHGRLGYVTEDQIGRHKESGKASHDWRFNATYGTGETGYAGWAVTVEEQKCRVCGKKREVTNR